MRIISSQSFFLYAARPTVISTGTEQSGVEWRNLRPQWYQCLPLPLSFRPQRSKAEWSGEISGPNGTSASPPTVISTATEQSGVEWRNLRPQWHSPITVGDLSTQSINGVQMPLSSYRHAAPLEMTCWRAAHSHGEQKQMTQIPHPPTCHFDRNGAKRSGVEKSPAPTAQAPLRWEISRLRASMEFKYLDLPADTQPRSR